MQKQDRKGKEMEQKKDSVFKKVSKVYFVCLGLYLLGWLPVLATDLEYRMWVSILGSSLLFLGVPVWLFLLWFRWHARERKSRALRCVVTAVLAVLFLWWCCFYLFSLVIGLQEERNLFGGYVVVNRAENMLSRSKYDLCKTRALFFRENVEWDSAFEIKYLERKYRQDFIEVSFDKENMLFFDNYGGGSLYRETVPVSPAHQNLPIHVFLSGGELQDDYVDLLAKWYVAEGCRELAIDRSCEIEEDGNLRLHFTGREDIEAAAADLQKLMAYALQDEIFKEYAGAIYLSPEDAEWNEYIYIPFGKVNRGNGTEYGYEEDLRVLCGEIERQYERIIKNRRERLKREKEREKMQEETEKQREPESAASDDEAEQSFDETGSVQESIYAEKARLICENFKASTDITGEFTVEYNARGEEYYSIGEDGDYSYTLVYDGDSENGACSLYVLYRSPCHEESGTYYHYTDEMTQIMDIYAVVKETGEVISSGRKAWSDPGNERYRKAVGE